MPPTTVARDARPASERDLEAGIRVWGDRLFALMDADEPPSIFSKKGLYGALIAWAMRDAHFKTQLFRFVDVLPALSSSAEISRHLKEYLGDERSADIPVRAPSLDRPLKAGLPSALRVA